MSDPHQGATSKQSLAWGFAAQVLNVGTWAILLPMILHFMSRATIGIWLVFASIAGLVQLLELGFQNVLSRNFSYVYAGAQTLQRSGLGEANDALNVKLLRALVEASRRIYLVIAVLAAIALGVGGTLYLWSVMPREIDPRTVFESWAAFSAGYVIHFYFGYLGALLQGRGDIQKANQVVVVTKFTQLIISVGLVYLGLGLVGLGIASLLSIIVSRSLSYRYAYGPGRTKIEGAPPQRDEVTSLIAVMWHNAGRYGVVLIGAFLVGRATVLIAASRIGVVESAGYSLALQLLVVIQTVSQLPFNLLLPRLDHLQAKADLVGAHRVFATAMASCITLFLGGGLPLVLAGSSVLSLLRSSTHLPSPILLLVMTLASLLELVHGLCANFIVTRNEVPFRNAALITGFFVVVVGWAVTPYLGIAGLVATTAVCQLVYNNWKWPIVAARILHDRFWHMLLFGFKNLIQVVQFQARVQRT